MALRTQFERHTRDALTSGNGVTSGRVQQLAKAGGWKPGEQGAEPGRPAAGLVRSRMMRRPDGTTAFVNE